jgi:Major Facilitator Superfamily
VTLTARQSVIALFAMNAALMAGTFSRLPEVQLARGLTDADFGWVLAFVSLGILAAMQVSPRLMAAGGARRVLWQGTVLGAAVPPLLAVAPGFWTLSAAMLLAGYAGGQAGVALNVEADRQARVTGQPLLAVSHGAWAAGFLAVSALAAGLIRLGITPAQQFCGLGALSLAAGLALIRGMEDTPDAAATGATPARRVVLPGRVEAGVMGFALISVITEIQVRSWSIIVLRDMLGAADWIAALSLPAFIAAVAAGRFLADSVERRTGALTFARGMAAVTGAGVALLAFSPSPVVGILACAIVGLGVSASYPLAIAAIARRRAGTETAAISGFIVLQNAIAFVMPVLYGAAAEGWGQRAALLLLLPVSLVAWLTAREVAR